MEFAGVSGLTNVDGNLMPLSLLVLLLCQLWQQNTLFITR